MNVPSKPTAVVWLAGAVALGAIAARLLAPGPAQPAAAAPMIALEKMGHLASVRVNYADVIEFTEKRAQDIPWTQWEIRFGGTSVILVARGDCTVGTDLRAARYDRVDADHRTVVVSLPEPKALVARVSHEAKDKGGSYFYAITNQGLEALIPDSSNRIKAIDSALARAESDIRRACSHADVVATARRNAEDVLIPTFRAVGWTARIAWQR